jgi:D-cysteine desulfhydrase
MATGILVDPVYSGKAIHGMLRDMKERPEEWEGARVLFVHTGGLLGMYEKVPQLDRLVTGLDRAHRMQV